MTITATVKYLLEHPFFKQAIIAYNRGDDKDIQYVLQELQIHTWLTVAKDCSVAFRQNKRANDPQIIEAIRDVEPPTSLDIRFPIPLKQEHCKVITLSPPKVKHHKSFKIENQLELVFSYKTKKAPKYIEALVG